MFRARLLTVSLATSAALMACSESTPTGTPAATNTVARFPTDTGTGTSVTQFNLTGKVLGVDVVAGSGNDTLRFTPIVGAQVKLMRNLLVDGKATQVAAGEVASSPTGGYQFSNLPGGYYVVYVTPPAGSPFASSFSYVAGNAPSVVVNVYLWKGR